MGEPGSQRRSNLITAQALRLALVPTWDPVGSAEYLTRLAGGTSLPLRRALAKLETELAERPSRTVTRAARALRLAVDGCDLRPEPGVRAGEGAA